MALMENKTNNTTASIRKIYRTLLLCQSMVLNFMENNLSSDTSRYEKNMVKIVTTRAFEKKVTIKSRGIRENILPCRCSIRGMDAKNIALPGVGNPIKFTSCRMSRLN